MSAIGYNVSHESKRPKENRDVSYDIPQVLSASLQSLISPILTPITFMDRIHAIHETPASKTRLYMPAFLQLLVTVFP